MRWYSIHNTPSWVRPTGYQTPRPQPRGSRWGAISLRTLAVHNWEGQGASWRRHGGALHRRTPKWPSHLSCASSPAKRGVPWAAVKFIFIIFSLHFHYIFNCLGYFDPIFFFLIIIKRNPGDFTDGISWQPHVVALHHATPGWPSHLSCASSPA